MTLHNAESSEGFNIALKKVRGKKKKRKRKRSYYNTGYSYLVTHPSTNPAEQGLTLLGGRDMVLPLWYSDSTLNVLFFLFLIREKVLILVGKLRTKKNERDENENYICFGDPTRSGTFFTEYAGIGLNL